MENKSGGMLSLKYPASESKHHLKLTANKTVEIIVSAKQMQEKILIFLL
jgi:hypothetical protein